MKREGFRWLEATPDERDRAKRVSDTYNVHMVAAPHDNLGRWIAVRLSDGGSDGVLYDTRPDAIRHQLHESQCAYLQLRPTYLSPQDAHVFLRFAEHAYDAGLRMTDPPPHDTSIIGRSIWPSKGRPS